ncbi:MAG: TPM domain-containing protein [Rhodococcus sp. (in: high G+C Gram-positive bacteria)]
MNRRRKALVLVLAAMIAALALVGCSDGSSTQDSTFEGLTGGQRIYDRTGYSLSEAQTADLERRLTDLEASTGADVIAYVRELDADSDDTLDQVEALQQTWVAATGIDQDTAGAILINREPGTTDEARAGIFVGTTFDDGNVPTGEQEAIVEDALVPPLRDGDVAGSLNAGIERLGSSIRNGPPTNALNEFADGPGSTWLPWVGGALSVLGLGGIALLFRGRAKPTLAEQPATIIRPDHTTDPAMATALVHGSPRPSAVPAVVLALATRDALDIEQEKEPSWGNKGTIAVRLLDEGRVRSDEERAVWSMLAEHAVDGRVGSKELKKLVAQGAGGTKDVVNERMRENGWLADGTGRSRLALAGLAVLGFLLTIGGIVVGAAGSLLMLVTIVPAVVLLVAGGAAAGSFSRLSVAGRDAARPWEAYRDGLKKQGKDEDAGVDLDAALPDIMALGLIADYRKRLEAATDSTSGTTLRAFASPAGAAVFPWAAFAGVWGTSAGGGSVASGGGAGGGGGAAGST